MTSEPRPGQERMIADPKILAGKPVVRGTRIAIDLVLEELAQNPDIRELLAAHPDLTREDVKACLAYAKALVTGEEVTPEAPQARNPKRPPGMKFLFLITHHPQPNPWDCKTSENQCAGAFRRLFALSVASIPA